MAGGLELALWCDLRVVEEDAVFGVFCRRWGVPLIDGGTVRLPRLIGASRAMDLILTGRPVAGRGGAHRAGQPGGPRRQARQAAEELAAELAAFPQTCLRHDRLLGPGAGRPERGRRPGRNELGHGRISLTSPETPGESPGSSREPGATALLRLSRLRSRSRRPASRVQDPGMAAPRIAIGPNRASYAEGAVRAGGGRVVTW